MSTLNKYDLVLLGNVVVDDVYKLNEWANEGTSNRYDSHHNSIGGIGNIIEALKERKLKIKVEYSIGSDTNGQLVQNYFDTISAEYKLHTSSQPTSHALILSNLQSNERTSFVNWGCGHDPIVSNNPARWTHVSYLDIIYKIDLEALRPHSDVLSADLCLSNPSQEVIDAVRNQLQFLDYLFVSESELPALANNPEELLSKYKLSCLVYHKRDRTLIFKNNGYKEVLGNHQLQEQVQVLGAGDAYCANFMFSKLNNNATDEESVLWAHEQATKFILGR